MKCTTSTKAFLTAAMLLQCLAPLAHAAQGGAGEADGAQHEKFSVGDIVAAQRDSWKRPYDGTVMKQTATGYIVQFPDKATTPHFAPEELTSASKRDKNTEFRILAQLSDTFAKRKGRRGKVLFPSHVRWERFETKDASPHIQFSEGGKAVQNTRPSWSKNWVTVRAAEWVSSSGSTSGTVTRLGGGGYAHVGVILRGQDSQFQYGQKVEACLHRNAVPRKHSDTRPSFNMKKGLWYPAVITKGKDERGKYTIRYTGINGNQVRATQNHKGRSHGYYFPDRIRVPMNQGMWESGMSYFYDSYEGCIRKGDNGRWSVLQWRLPNVNAGDKVTVVVKDGKLSFAVNGEVQGTPIHLPDVEVAMAVSLYRGPTHINQKTLGEKYSKVRLT